MDALGKTAYMAYMTHHYTLTNTTAVVFPPWEALNETERAAWEAVAEAVVATHTLLSHR